MSQLSLILLGLLLLLVVAVLAWKYFIVHLKGASRSFYNALNEWEQLLGVNDRYETPWLLMVGDDERSEPLLQGWGLTPVARPAWFGRWWYGPEGAVLVLPQALFSHGENAGVQLKLWRQLLDLLVQSRARRPLDGVIWLHAMEQLSGDSDSAAEGAAARRKFIDLQQRLGLSLPVYMVITASEGLKGLPELIDVLPLSTLGTPLGWTSPYGTQTHWHPSWISQGVGLMQQTLSDLLVEIGTLRGQLDTTLYLLPQQLHNLNDPLQSLCDPVFQGNALGEAPRLRGIYLSATAKVDSDADNVDPFAETGPVKLPPPLFSQRLWRQRIVAEHGLAQPIGRILHLRQRWQRMLGLGTLVFAVLWLAGMIWAWQDRSSDAQSLADLLYDDQLHTPPTIDDDAARQRIQSFWRLLILTPRWQLSALTLPGSWFSNLDQQLAQELRVRAREQLFEPIHSRLQRDLDSLTGVTPTQRDNTTLSSANAYQQAIQIVNDAVSLEAHNRRLVQSVQGDERPLDDAVSLANDLFGLNMVPKSLPLNAQYNQVLAVPLKPLSTSMDMDGAKPKVSARYLAAMRLWLDTLFASANYKNIGGPLNEQLRNLQSSQRSDLADLEAISNSFDQLRQLVALTNTAWSQAAGNELTPGYQADLEKARHSSLINVNTVDQVQRYADTARRTFHERWLERGEDQLGILREQSGGVLALQTNLDQLDQGIDALLREDFSQAALNRAGTISDSGESLHNLDTTGLDAALHFYTSYQAFLQQQVAALPVDYRQGMIGAARRAASSAMWKRLNAQADSSVLISQTRLTASFNLPVDKARQVLQALGDVGDSRQVELLRRELNGRAMSDLRRAAEDLQRLPLLHLPIDFSQWDGTPNLSLRSFREPDVQSLKLSLGRQFSLIGDGVDSIRPAIDWLGSQREYLNTGEGMIVDEFVETTLAMKKFGEQNPTSPPLLYQQLLVRDFNDMDLSTCSKILGASALPDGRGRLATLARNAWDQAHLRCAALQDSKASMAWQQLSTYFNTYLAGRFPFVAKDNGIDANPDRVREFLELIDKYKADAYSGLQGSNSINSGAAAEFLFNLQNARLWLGPLLIRDKEGLRGLDLEVRWRTDREEERGADQVIDWNLATGAREVSYPAESISHANWVVGEPVRLALRWAKGSNQRPQDDSTQPNLAINDLQASWSYEGPWALLRFIRSNQASSLFTSQNDDDRPLALHVPVRSDAKSNANAQMFLRFAIKAIGGKQPLTLTPLPVSVPPSPYNTVYPLPVSSIETQP